jgi:hypothetical protein
MSGEDATAGAYTTLSALGMNSALDRRVGTFKQQTSPWFEVRLGCLTGSKVSRLMTLDGKLKAASTRETLLNELVIERLVGAPTSHGSTVYMDRGNQCEGLARIQYWLDYKAQPIEVGYVIGEPCSWGCSPDGLLPPGKGLEIKCRTAKEHMHYLRRQRLQPEDMMQVQFDMWCCGLAEWEFFAYWPNDTRYAVIETYDGGVRTLSLPSWCATVEADPRLHDAFAVQVPAFCALVSEEVKAIRERVTA